MKHHMWKALDGMSGGRWTKGTAMQYVFSQRRLEVERCAIGWLVHFQGTDQEMSALADTLWEMFPQRAVKTSPPWNIIISVNDHLDTTKEDMLVAMEKAAIKMDEMVTP